MTPWQARPAATPRSSSCTLLGVSMAAVVMLCAAPVRGEEKRPGVLPFPCAIGSPSGAFLDRR